MKTGRRHISLSCVAIILIAAFLLLRMFNNHRYTVPEKVIAWDVISYYSYLPATFIEHDLTLSFTEQEHTGSYWPETLADGSKVIKTTMGLSLMYCPFFLVAHTVAPLLGYPADGFSPPYAFALMMAGIFYTLLGLILLRKVLLRHFREWITTVTLIIVAHCTNLYWYSVYEAPMSHAFSFCLFALLAMLTELWHEKSTVERSIGIGLTLGLISLIRPTNALVVLYFLLYGIQSKESLRSKWLLLTGAWWKLLLMGAAILLVWVPQMLYWHTVTGHFLYYSYGNSERFFFGAPKLLKGLFEFRKGWLIYTPVMLFALLGLIPLYRRHRAHFWGITVFFVVNLYVVFSWWCWWYGGGLSIRALIESYALLAIPLAAWIEWAASRKLFLRCALMTLLCVVAALSAYHNIRYIYGSIHWDSMTRAAYFDSFLHPHPTDRFHSLLDEPDYEAARQGIR
ncbi:MAG: hypothetical protein J6V98_03155 [Bacteroidales bacterium]|nr:hypothetical protein [Bacteroidales bacterium]